MNNKLTATTFAILAFAMASIALVVGLSQTTSITAADAPKGNQMYIFAEGVSPQVTFEFRDQTVTYDFQMYDVTSNLFSTSASGFSTKQVAPEFTLIRAVGDTPYLHEAVDQTFEHGKSGGFEYPYKEFDVTVEMIQAGQSMRTMEYDDCSINNYKINSRTDNEEGYTTGKTGFALVETYTFVCTGFTPSSPLYDKMMEEKQNQRPYQ